jgi:twitching motility protein PilT
MRRTMVLVLQLGQLLDYLDRDGISEIVVGTGRPITVKKGGAYQPLMSTAMSTAQIEELVRGSALASLIPDRDTNGASSAQQVLGKHCLVQIARRGESLIIKIESNGGALGVGAASPQRSEPRVASDRAAERITPSARAPMTAAPATIPAAAPAISASPRSVASVSFRAPIAELPSPATRSSQLPIAPAFKSLELDLDDEDSGFDVIGPASRNDSPPAEDPEDSFDLDLDLSSDLSSSDAGPAPASSSQRPASPSGVAPGLAAIVHRLVPERFVALVRTARQHGATDLHLSAGQPALVRTVGQLQRVGEVLDAAAVAAMIEPWLNAADRAALEQRGYVDLALDVAGKHAGQLSRIRANVSRQRGGLKGSFRLVWEGVPTLELLGLPRDLARVTSYHQGLVVIAGPSGHGKTTTLAALVDLINSTRPHHILCIEDPVEIVHSRKTAVVSQREVGLHTVSFVSALKASLREDPDVIVIGEVRDRETVEIALTAAETGHLVIATMSTPSAAKTIDRLIDMFPPDDQTQVRVSLAAALRFIVAQRLLPKRGGAGVVPAVELLTGVLPLAALIRDNKLFQLPNLQQRGRAFGMIRFDDSILELVRSGVIDEDVAIAAAENKREMHAVLHPPEPAVAPPAQKPWDDAKQRLGGLFKREREKE